MFEAHGGDDIYSPHPAVSHGAPLPPAADRSMDAESVLICGLAGEQEKRTERWR